ncbi:MAG: mechanosensitive ion channel family protein [Candidatus Bathyarchaeota archaeon]
MSFIPYQDVIVGAGIIVVSILIALGLLSITKKYVTRLFEKKTRIQKYLISTVKGPISLLIIVVGIITAFGYWNTTIPDFLPYWMETNYFIVTAQILTAILIIRFIVTLSSNYLTIRSEKIIKQRPETAKSIKSLNRVISYFIYIVGIVVVIYLFLLSPVTPAMGSAPVSSALLFLVGLIVILVILFILNIVFAKYINRIVMDEPKLLTTVTFLRRLTLGTVAIIGVAAVTFTVFPAVGGAVASLFIAAGFASIVLGLAAQSSLSNLVSGLLISTSQPFRIGEAVMFKNDFCFVEDIKLMYTTLRTWDNRRLQVPNSLFQSEVIVNYSIGDKTMLVPIPVQVSYESDIGKALKIMVDLAKKHPECLPIGDLPNAVVLEFADSGINLRLLSRTKDQPTAWRMSRELLFQIKNEFDANGIEIPYPRRFMVPNKALEEQISKIADSLQAIAGNSEKQVKGKQK